MTERTHNGKWSPQREEVEESQTPEQHVGLKVLRQAVDDLKLLCGYGLITKAGKCKKWPSVIRHGKYQTHRDYMCIGGMREPHEHEKLRDWFLLKDQGQMWCDLIGWRMPCAEIFWFIVRQQGANK